MADILHWIPLNDLTFTPTNPNEGDIGAIYASIARFGYRDIIHVRSGNVTKAGQHRIQALRQWVSQQGFPGVRGEADKCLRLTDGVFEVAALDVDDLSDAEADALMLAFNRTSRLGRDDDAMLAKLLQDLQAEDASLIEAAGYSGDDLDELLRALGQTVGLPDPGAQVNRADELQAVWQVQRGDVWEIESKACPGKKHRVMCGDSTSAEDVGQLMNGQLIDIVFTSPPYNGGNIKTGAYHGSKSKRHDFKQLYTHDMDNKSSEEYCIFLLTVLNVLANYVSPVAPILWNVSYNANSRFEYGVIVFSKDHPFTVKETIIWDKGHGMNIVGNMILSRSTEFIFLLSKGDTYYTNQHQAVWWNIWRIPSQDGDNMQQGHGASFPVQLPFDALTKFSTMGGIGYDPFLGSGTTVVACEQAGRLGMGMEIFPPYISVCLQRLKDMGLQPKRVSDYKAARWILKDITEGEPAEVSIDRVRNGKS